MTIRITFTNSSSDAIYVQVDPWAGIYLLRKGDAIVIEADSDFGTASIEIDETGETRVLTLPHCNEYFVVENDRRIHWTDFATNIPE